MRALLIDDSSTMRSILRMILRKAGFETFEAGNGEEGLRQLELHGVMDLALVDWNMPAMNGFEFVCKVRENAAYAQMCIVMVTTETEFSQMQTALAHGANEYIMKPFTKESVLDKLLLLGMVPQTL